MTIIRHTFRNETDMSRILELLHKIPLTSSHLLDLPWRLSSPTIYEGHDATFWEDSNAQVIGFAAWQYYWATLDFFILPSPQEQAVETELFAWADARFQERDKKRGYPLPYWIEYRNDDLATRHFAEAHGFLLDEDRYAILQHPLTNLPPISILPDGFSLRSFNGEEETLAYTEVHRAAFESPSMTPEWRARTIRMPQYHPDLDLVACAPDGSLAGFCVGWFESTRHIAQIEPIGVHPHFQRRGLARALLLEMLRRFQKQGAKSAIIEPFASNLPIQRACKSIGFQQVHTISAKGKWLS